MAWAMADSVRSAWRERLQRFSASNLTVVRFCEREGVSTASFYQWRRRLSGQGTFQRLLLSDGGSNRESVDADVVSIEFADVRIKVPADRVELVGTVVGELFRASLSEGDGVRDE